MSEEILDEIREKIVNAIGLETYQGDEDMYLTRDGDGTVESGVQLSDEVDEIVSIFREKLTEIEVNIEKELEKQIFSTEEIKDIGVSWTGHPCVGFNKAIRNALEVVTKYLRV